MENAKSIELSVIIPTHNRKESLERCILSLDKQDYAKDKYEIIVVDDGSRDGSEEMINSLKIKCSNLRYIQQYHKGPAAARNLGAAVSLGEIIAFIDDDCSVPRDWIRLITESHHRHVQALVVGGVTFISTEKTSVLVSQFLSTCSIETSFNGKKEIIFFPTCNVSFKRSVFQRHKFNEKFPLPGGEDLEFFWRLFKVGYRFIWDKNIQVIHYRSDGLTHFIKQAYVYGRGNLLVQNFHKDHPLLKELKIGRISFWIATLINIIKIPRFSYLLGRRLTKEGNIKNIHKKLSIYSYFIIHKIFYILGNIVEFFRVKKESLDVYQPIHSKPQLLILDITHSCNLTCRICDIWKTGNDEKDIDLPYIKKMLHQAKELGIEEIALSGGEPLLRNDIFAIFDYAKEIKIRNLGVLTNGILVKKYIERLKPYLIDGTISLDISLDSLKPQTHNYIRNSTFAWQESLESLRMLSLLKKEYTRVNFNVITIILNQNLQELLDLAVFIKSLGVNSLQFQALLPNNLRMAERKESDFWVVGDRLHILDQVIDGLIKLKIENQQFIKNSPRNLELIKKYYRGAVGSDDIKCLSTDKTVLIANQGECVTCFSSYGDIKKQNLKDVLSGSEIIKARERVRKCPWPCLLPCFCD